MESKYSARLQEEELKLHVATDWFGAFDCKRRIGKIDFCVDIPATELGLYDATAAMWAESKSGTSKDIIESFVQLILTIGRAKVNQSERPPFFLGAFDAAKIAFLPYESVIEVFTQNDFNWNVTPSDHATKEFKQLYALVKATIEEKSLLYDFIADADELKKFIKENFKTGTRDVSRIQITRNNFTHIYQKWRVEVMPSLAVDDWDELRKQGIIDADFFLADILSRKNQTLRKKLFVLLKSDTYELKYGKAKGGLDLLVNIGFNDGQKAHTRFWNRYNRPPREDYWDFIVSRRDLLVDQDVRERKGAFFTPQKWVALSQEYLAKALGDDWQDRYYVWDCCGGTGNLEAGLTNKYNVWVSTLDKADVDVIHTRIKMMEEKLEGSSNLLDSHVFQFDFLNGSFDDLPKGLRDIVNDPEKRKRLVVYINPPYAEAGDAKQLSGCGKNKTNVAVSMRTYEQYKGLIGIAGRELFAQFLIRIDQELRGCHIGVFSTMKHILGPNFRLFRTAFQPTLSRMFIIPAATFDNVNGNFPISFAIWNTNSRQAFDQYDADVFDEDGVPIGKKKIATYDCQKTLTDWMIGTRKRTENIVLGFNYSAANDIQHNNYNRLETSKERLPSPRGTSVTSGNVIESCVYLSVRHVVDANWLNDRDQYIYPLEDWETDKVFVSDCIAYVLFAQCNNIQSQYGTNHWIPFTESEVGAKDTFDSHFMSDFIAGKVGRARTSSGTVKQQTLGLESPNDGSSISASASLPDGPIRFSPTAQSVLDAGRELWRYYHAQPNANPNASYYDIRRHFQGVKTDAKGKEKMNATSVDETYNALLDALKAAMRDLAKEIAPKVYEYGFLK